MFRILHCASRYFASSSAGSEYLLRSTQWAADALRKEFSAGQLAVSLPQLPFLPFDVNYTPSHPRFRFSGKSEDRGNVLLVLGIP